jgi:hypothetical protein
MFHLAVVVLVAAAMLVALVIVIRGRRNKQNPSSNTSEPTSAPSVQPESRVRQRKPRPPKTAFAEPTPAIERHNREERREIRNEMVMDSPPKVPFSLRPAVSSPPELCIKCNMLARKAACLSLMCRDCCIQCNGFKCEAHTTLVERTKVGSY